MHVIEKALLFALRVHEGKQDRTGQPYILHPLHLMMQMESDTERLAAILHDTVEDSTHTLDDVRALGVPADVVRAVELLTHDKENEPYLEYVRRLRADPVARRVKMADLRHNMDIRRLPQLTTRDYDRLARYRQAWEILTAGEEAIA
jgi:(p)ppGpp synthase/HD superfamily hydrolase